MSKFNEKFLKCPLYYTIEILGGKWKWIILWKIFQHKTIRYNRLHFLLDPIAHKTLSIQLKELEKNKLINRKQYNTIPPKVEYSLTEKGETLIPILKQMNEWGNKNMISD